MTHFIDSFIKEIENFTPAPHDPEVGVVTRVSDGVVEIDGLAKATMSEMLRFNTAHGKPLEKALKERQEIFGIVLNLEEGVVRAILLGDTALVREGTPVHTTGQVLTIPVGEELLGRVVNPLGETVDGRGSIITKTHNALERQAYGVMDRSSVNTPLQTGIKAIDAMIPIGRGQRELIIGDRYTGKTTVAIDTILNQLNEPEATRPLCIYVAIGQKESKTARIVTQLREAGAMDYTVVVNAGASAPASLQYLAPFAGAAIGEYFMDSGRDALVVYDDLSKHAVAYRELSLLLRRPPGREAYPGDIFYLHSRLLERAAKLSKEKGGGSLTALPIIETQENDVSAYIPTNVISITDGQIFLETDLFNKGIRPAINAGISVSRVGSAAQTKAIKKVSGKLRIELAQFRDLEAFMQFSQDLDPETKKRIEHGQRLVAALTQKNGEPLAFEAQAVLLYAAINNFLENIHVEKVSTFEKTFLQYIYTHNKNILSNIRESKEMSTNIESELIYALNQFLATHPQLTGTLPATH